MSASVSRNGIELFVPTFPSGRRPIVSLSIDATEVGTLRRLRHDRWVAVCTCGVELVDVDPVSPIMHLLGHRLAVEHG